MSTPFNKAGIVRVGIEVNAAEHYMHHEVPGEKNQQRKRQDALSNPSVRSGEAQGSNAGNVALLSKTPVSDNGKTLPAFSQPVISGSGIGAPIAKCPRQPTADLFNSLLEMDRSDFFGVGVKNIAQALQGFDVNMPVQDNVTMLEAALLATANSPDGTTVVQALMEVGTRFDLIDPDRSGVLQGAIKSNSLDLVKSLISRGKGKNTEEMHKALHYALLQCDPELALAIVKSMREINSSLVDVPSLLPKAAVLGNLELVEQICALARPDINKPCYDGSTALAHAATYMAEPDIIAFLLSNGAKVNGTDEEGTNNAVAAALSGISRRRLAGYSDEEIGWLKHRKLQTLQTILFSKNVAIDFDMKISDGRYAAKTLLDLAAEAGPEFVTCLMNAQLERASGRTGVQPSTGNFKH